MSKGVSALGRGVLVAAAALALAGCSMGSMFGGGGSSTAGANLANATPSQAQIAAAQVNALPAIATECPPIRIRNGGEAMFRYAGAVGDPRSLQYQGVIDEVSRNCVVSNGQISVNMGATGRVLLGPAGSQSSINAPVRFAVEREGTAVFSQKYDIPVAITGQSGRFVKVIENVTVPYLNGDEITIWVGFDTRG